MRTTIALIPTSVAIAREDFAAVVTSGEFHEPASGSWSSPGTDALNGSARA